MSDGSHIRKRRNLDKVALKLAAHAEAVESARKALRSPATVAATRR
jgi:hypothetical protein